MKHKIFTALAAVIMLCVPSYADDLMDWSRFNTPMPELNDMSMGKVMPNYTGTGSFVETETKGYNLRRMKQMNPDFNTYPEANGIIWLKNVTCSRSESGGMEITRLYVILGRRGLSERWLNWNIQTPAKGSTEILEASIYDFNSLAKISTIPPEEDLAAGVKHVRFAGLPETFIIAVSWREILPDMLNIEGLIWLQEDLRVWESTAVIHSPLRLAYTSFPSPVNPETEDLGNETVYSWRKINVDPYDDRSEIARVQRAGIAFGVKQGTSGVQGMIKDAENAGNIPANPEALSAFKRSKEAGTLKLIEWLSSQPEIILAEGTPRRIPSSGALTKREKLLLAKSWLVSQKVDASLTWILPFEPDDRSPVSLSMFLNPVLDVQEIKGVTFHDMNDPLMLGGTKIFSLNNDGKLFSRRIPSHKSGDNRLSAVMDLNLTEQGIMNGTVRIIPRGAWNSFLLGKSVTEGAVRGAVLSLFPGLTNYRDARYKIVKGIPEMEFKIENKPGIGGTGRGILAILPFFEPVFVRKLGTYEPPVELKFPFIMDMEITLSFPKNAEEALVSGKTVKNPDKINFSSSYQNRRHRLLANSRFEINMQSVSSGNMPLLRRCLENWRIFSSKHIPIRQ
ncbi:MAG: hypothetical protein IJ697_05450 [Synergistaceae bacterium]|nr:hypothetical protein [Synergistaceae bacterium]